MDQFVEFLTHHWVLSTLFVVLLMALFIYEGVYRSRFSKGLTPEAVVQLMNHEKAQLIDVRNMDAYRAGHILGSLHMPFEEFEKKKEHWKNYKNQTIVIIGQTAQENSKILSRAKELEITVYELEGGIGAWRAAGLPLIKS